MGLKGLGRELVGVERGVKEVAVCIYIKRRRMVSCKSDVFCIQNLIKITS
jgi:hypothetical protein